MRKSFTLSPHVSIEAAMKRIGYDYHCAKDGRPCYHRRLNDPAFPRFHAYSIEIANKLQIDLHFDALDPIGHKGNHDQTWAYEGSRVSDEMRRITEILEDHVPRVAGTERLTRPASPPSKEQNWFDMLFK
ncbi:hypothetical protein HZA85_03130 [Candidatus Uhrbacteria bacterium]|nr:hypothetical protein [Candidatus Uhrbacteria bacterium]